MKKKLFRNCHWFSLAVCLSSLLFCANPIVAQNNMPEDVTVLNARAETDRYKSSYSGDMHPPKKQICLYFMT